jgi:hypothetical protein
MSKRKERAFGGDEDRQALTLTLTLTLSLTTVKRMSKRKERAFGGDEDRQAEESLHKEAYRVLKIEKAKVRIRSWS